MKKRKFVLSPDFSQYTDISRAERIFNAYRRQFIGAYWQQKGVKIIPTVGFDDENSYDYSIDCLENNTAVAISTVGIRTENEKKIFINGLNYLENIITPCLYVVYGWRDFLFLNKEKCVIIEPFYKELKNGR